MVEFALAIPLLLILCGIVYEGGNLFYTYFRMSSAAFEGSRFCSGLSAPASQCFFNNKGSAATNLSTKNLTLWKDPPPTNPTANAVWEFHKLLQGRVAALFLVNPAGWQIRSDEEIGPEYGQGGTVKVSDVLPNYPSIESQFIGVITDPKTLAQCATAPTASQENSCSVCISATYVGKFFNIPVEACSTSYLLLNNELLTVPFNSPEGNFTLPGGN